MASEMVPIGNVEKPGELEHKGAETPKATSLSETSVDQPIKLEANAQIEIYSDMGRTRTGIQESKQRWGDRLFSAGDSFHPCSKPRDKGRNPY